MTEKTTLQMSDRIFRQIVENQAMIVRLFAISISFSILANTLTFTYVMSSYTTERPIVSGGIWLLVFLCGPLPASITTIGLWAIMRWSFNSINRRNDAIMGGILGVILGVLTGDGPLLCLPLMLIGVITGIVGAPFIRKATIRIQNRFGDIGVAAVSSLCAILVSVLVGSLGALLATGILLY